MRLLRLLPLCLLVLSAPLLAQPPDDALPLSEAVYGAGARVLARYPEGWRAFQDDTGTLYLTSTTNLYGDDNLLEPDVAVMSIRSRLFADTPRIPPNENTLVATRRLVPGTNARSAYRAVPAEFTRLRAGELSAPFLPNHRHYLLFINLEAERFAEVTISAAPGAFDALLPTFEQMIETLVFVDSPPPDTSRAGFGQVYFPTGFTYPGTSLYDSLNGNLEFDLPRGWQVSEPSWNDITITNRQNRNAPYLLPGEFTAQAVFAPIPQDAVKTPLSLLYDALPAAKQRILQVDTFTWNGIEFARAVLSDSDFIITRLVLEPPPPIVEGEDPREPELTHYFTMRVTLEPNSLDTLEGSIFTMLSSVRMINETFYPFETIDYGNFDIERFANSRVISARADMTTYTPAGWYVLERGNSLIVRNNSQPIDIELNTFDQFTGDEALVELSVQNNNFWADRGITSQTRFHEIPYLLTDNNVSEVTVINFNGQQALSYTSDFFTYTLILPVDDFSYVQARLAFPFEDYDFYVPRVLAMMARTARTPLGGSSGSVSSNVTEVFTARSQRVQFDVPQNWFTSENPEAAVSSALIGIPNSGTLRGDPASPEFQAQAAALLTITYTEPPTYAVVDDEGNVEVFALPLYNYLYERIGDSDILPEQTTVAGYPALRRIKDGSGHILIQRTDGSIVQVYVQNLTGNPTQNNYDFGFEDAMYNVLNTLRYPAADATEPTEVYVSGTKNFRVQYPYEWSTTNRSFEFIQGEGEDAVTVTENVVYFSNVLDFDPANIAPGQVRIGVQVEPAEIRRDVVPRQSPNFRVEIGDAINGQPAIGSIYNSYVVFTAETEAPFRRVAVTLETTPADLERFYPTIVKMVQSLEYTVTAPAPETTSDAQS